jgi:ankyrin repeat protein
MDNDTIYHIFMYSTIKDKIRMLRISRGTRDSIYEVLGGKENVITLLQKERDAYVQNTNDLKDALNRYEDDLKRFIFMDLNLNVVSDHHRTILTHYVEDNDIKTVKTLLEKGSSPNKGYPLHLACRNGLYDMMKILVKAGADVNLPDEYGITPLMYAAEPSSNETFHGYDSEGDPDVEYDEIDKMPFVTYLIQKGANKDIVDRRGETAAMYANDDKVKEYLMK